jgi:hypothetical protein
MTPRKPGTVAQNSPPSTCLYLARRRAWVMYRVIIGGSKRESSPNLKRMQAGLPANQLGGRLDDCYLLREPHWPEIAIVRPRIARWSEHSDQAP